MQTCGICKEKVDFLKRFTDFIGNPAVQIYKIILECTRRAKRKYIEEGVCYRCASDLADYHESVVLAKKIKMKILNLIDNKNDGNSVTYGSDGAKKSKIDFELNYSSRSLMNGNLDSDNKEDELIKHCYICDECGESFSDGYSCKIHKDKTHNPKFVCKECGKVFKSRYNFKRHVITHDPVKPFECEICLERFHFQNILQNHHEAKHTNNRSFKCKLCGLGFPHRMSLNSHMMVHKNHPLNFKCEICEKRFRNASRLKAHQQRHSAKKEFICKYCNHGFNVKYYLTQHLKENKMCIAAFAKDKEYAQQYLTIPQAEFIAE